MRQRRRLPGAIRSPLRGKRASAFGRNGRMSAMDWGPVMSTGITGIAGIAGTLLSARMTGSSKDRRAKLTEKRRVYAAERFADTRRLAGAEGCSSV
jgi:hypothetical protein